MSRFGSFFRRNHLTIAVTIFTVALGTILLMLANASAKIQQTQKTDQAILIQVKNVADSLNAKAADRTSQINQLNRHLDCIVVFFTAPDRANKSISDIDTCTLTNNATGQTSNPIGASGVLEPDGTPQPATNPPAPNDNSSGNTDNSASGGSTQPGFLRRDIINPIKNLLDAL